MRSLGGSDGIEQSIGTDNEGNIVLKTDFSGSRAMTQAVIEQNKRMEGTGKGKDMWLAASIPPAVQYEWMHKYGIQFWNPDHKEGVRRLLNSDEYRYLRVNHFMM